MKITLKGVENEVKKMYNSTELKNIKYAFLQYSFELIEDVDYRNVSLCQEEYPEYDINIDGIYVDYDNSIFNLYISDYNSDLSFEKEIDYDNYVNMIEKAENLVSLISLKGFKKMPSNSTTFDICSIIHKSIYEDKEDFNIVINYVTNYCVSLNNKLDGVKEVDDLSVLIKTYDISYISSLKNEEILENKTLDVKKEFGDYLAAIRIAEEEDFDVYLTSINALNLAMLYKADGPRLLEANIRSYLKKKAAVNKGIVNTAQNEPEKFASYNNGLSAIATEAKIVSQGSLFKIQSLTNLQIINGGQTTATLSDCLNDVSVELDRIILPLKITILKNRDNMTEMIDAIAEYSNTQTPIKKSDTPSNKPFYKRIEELSNTISASNGYETYYCFFERTTNQYCTKKTHSPNPNEFGVIYPEKLKFNKLDLAKIVMCWEQYPYLVCRGPEKFFVFFNKIVMNLYEEIDSTYYKRLYGLLILYKKILEIAYDTGLRFQTNIAAYVLGLISKYTNKTYDLNRIWDNQKVDTDFLKTIKKMCLDVGAKINNKTIDARDWTKRRETWDEISSQPSIYVIPKGFEEQVFFPQDSVEAFIQNASNFKNIDLWKGLLDWYKLPFHNKTIRLNTKELDTINFIIRSISLQTEIKENAKKNGEEIFIKCVKHGFNWNKK